MRILSHFVLLPFLATAMGTAVLAAAPVALSVTVEGIADGTRVPDANVVCRPTPDGKSDHDGKNLRPAISWVNAPAAAQSFAIFVMDPDVPADKTDAGKEGKTLPTEAKREDFFHYGVMNIPAGTSRFPGGASDVVPTIGLQLPNDMGQNNYVASAAQFGGPCPPWNDARLHHYHFIVLALDAPADEKKAPDANETAKTVYTRLSTSPHLVARGEVVGTYSTSAKMK